MSGTFGRLSDADQSELLPVLIIGGDFTVRFANEAAHALFKREPGSLVGAFFEGLTPESRRHELQEIYGLFQQTAGRRMSSQAMCSDGTLIEVTMGLTPMLRMNGSVAALLVSYQRVPPWSAAAPNRR